MHLHTRGKRNSVTGLSWATLNVIPPSSPNSRFGQVPQQLSARGGEFSEPGIDSKNILNDLNCHQDVGLAMAPQITKFQIKPTW